MPQYRSQCGYILFIYSILIKTVMFRTCLYERNAEICKSAHTETHTHTFPDYALWPSAPWLSCRRPACPGEKVLTCRVSGWSCTASVWYGLHIYTLHKKEKEREGPLASTFPSNVYTPGNDKRALIRQGKQRVMRTTACPCVRLIKIHYRSYSTAKYRGNNVKNFFFMQAFPIQVEFN